MNTTREPGAELDGGRVRLWGFPKWPGWSFVVEGEAVTVVPPAGVRLDVETWRRLPIGQVLRRARALVQEDGALDVGALLASLFAGSDDEPDHLGRVARVYRHAVEQRRPPRAVVAEAFDRSEVTAARWIAAARDAGLIGSFADERARMTDPLKPSAKRQPAARRSTDPRDRSPR